MSDILEQVQRNLCQEIGCEFVPTPPLSKVGFAFETQGLLPLNGLRHPPIADTSGWYIWCGEQLSEAESFFSPLHSIHLTIECPEVVRFLGLPPGYRFLTAGDYIDVWFDPSLIDV
jgi:hypothetical protein